MASHMGYVCRFCGLLTMWDESNKYRNQKLCYTCGNLIARVLYNEDGEATQEDEDTLKQMCIVNLQSIPKRMVPIVARQRWNISTKSLQNLRCTKCGRLLGKDVKKGIHTVHMCIDCETTLLKNRSETRFMNRITEGKHNKSQTESYQGRRFREAAGTVKQRGVKDGKL